MAVAPVGNETVDPVAVAATVVAIAALAVAVWEGMANRRHNRLSVRPHLCYFQVLSGEKGLCGLRLRNDGFGPALIRRMTLSIDGGPEHQVTAKLWVQALNELGIPYPWVEATALDAGDAIASGEYESIFYIQEPQRTPERVEKLGAALQRLRVWAEYESLYGERFSVAWSWPVGVVPPEKDAT